MLCGDERTKLRVSRFINRKPAANFHHAVRAAELKGYPLNLLVSINLGCTGAAADLPAAASICQKLRDKFTKWATRPPVNQARSKFPGTFVWVLEKPSLHVNFHWLLHVPVSKQREFKERLYSWVASLAGGILDEAAIDVKAAPKPKGAGKYMLKGMHPSWAQHFDIEFGDQGEIFGKRSGYSRNIGPTEVRMMRVRGRYPQTRRYVKGLYTRPSTVTPRPTVQVSI